MTVLRRTFLGSSVLTLLGLSSRFVRAEEKRFHPDGTSVPVTGEAVPGLEPFDHLMTDFVRRNNVPGASVAVTRQGELIYSRGFGWADVENQIPVQPEDLFRIASVSKPITAVGIMQLVEQGRLSLDEPVVPRMKLEPHLEPDQKYDSRWDQITLRQCLQHTGGWDRSKSYDPIARVRRIARSLDISLPVSPNDIIRYMMGQPLDFDPGERYAYSNLGYLVLGRIMEVETGVDYESWTREHVFKPIGVTRPRLGKAPLQRRAPGEVRYYDSKNRTAQGAVPPVIGKQVPLQYGGENLDGYGAHGGWIASAPDLVRFASALDVPEHSPLLKPQSIAEMWKRPEGPAGHRRDGSLSPTYYGLGWNVRPVGTDGLANTWHGGLIAGTSTLLVRRWDGLCWAVLFNTQENSEEKVLSGLIDGPMHKAAAEVKKWPSPKQAERTPS